MEIAAIVCYTRGDTRVSPLTEVYMDKQERDGLLAQISQWYKDGQFSAIVQALEALPERDYQTALLLAWAYNSLAVLGDGRANEDTEEVDQPLLEKAAAVLESVAEEGEADPLWVSRMAYVLWMLPGREAEALPYARRWAAMEPETAEAGALVEEIVSFLNGATSPEMYTPEQMERVEQYIGETFGDYEQVFHELVSPDIHVDICMIPPAEGRNYQTLVTMGMGAHRMDVPEELAAYELERAELLICLPPDWRLDQEALQDERWYWPVRLLKTVARLPIGSGSWVAAGHTVGLGQGETYAGTGFSSVLLLPPAMAEGDCSLPEGDRVHFYQLLPLYPEELAYKLEHDMEELLRRMRPISFVVDVRRPRRLKKAPPAWQDGNKRGSY